MESKIIDMGRDTIIHIGDEAIFNAHIQNINGRLTKEDKVDFIYMHHEAYPNEEKITDTTFIWNTSNPVAKKNGDKLKKFIAKHFKKGMKVIDDNYISLNKSLANFYWPEEILHNKNKLFNTGGVVQITTLIS
ncbi:hypothetical protein NIASO_09130 [Niabella soli DSM 19437]|uniref:Uncharacterized protein n=2 Tax=Niabella TaxID=379899 RepID=W0F6R5_9BACT|nr:hypothetical protein NIASO_09130 [Niabella soli DSM 19437]